MAISYYSFDQGRHAGALLRQCLQSLESGLNNAIAVGGMMDQMLDAGVVSQPFADFFGFPDVATAQNACNEFKSMLSKITTNADVTNVNAALLQAFNKFR